MSEISDLHTKISQMKEDTVQFTDVFSDQK